MAVVPPSYANGTVSNSSQYKPVPWEQIPTSNHSTVSLNNMPHSSTVEYKGYFRSQATGLHTFSAIGSQGITSYAWVSGAPLGSTRIKTNDKVKVSNNTSYGIIIPYRTVPAGSTWRFEDTNVVGQFPGYGYWPKTGYGGSSMPAKFNTMYGGSNSPNTECGYTQTPHETWLPGDIRTYGPEYPGNQQKSGGPGWQGPEEEHFHSPCWDNGTRTSHPLVRLPNTGGKPSDSSANYRTMGKTSQVFLDTTFKAEGNDRENWGKYRVVHTNPNNSDEKFVWLDAVEGIRLTGQGKRAPERIHIQFSLKFTDADTYTFEWKTRDSLKLWYVNKEISQGDARNTRKLEPTTGKNPLNRDSGNTSETGWAPNSWDSSTQDYGEMTYEEEISAQGYIRFIGYATGIPANNTHGFSLVVKNSSGEVIWKSDQLTTDDDQIIGIDECGFNALLSDSDRLLGDEYRDTESFKDDGWVGNTGDLFTADFRAGDDEIRTLYDTRQYLPSNSLTRCRGGQSIQGSVYLRQGDYYFIRIIVSNHINGSNNFDFRVTTPTNVTQTVQFTGNGNPGSDTSVGGDAGSGNKINTQVLCNSTLYTQGRNSNDLNFAFVSRPSVGNFVLNLSGGSLDVPTNKIGFEGQQGLVGNTVVQAAGVTLTLAAGTELEASVTLSKLLRGGSDGFSEMSAAQIAAAQEEYRIQRNSGDVLSFGDFRNAITSKAVIQWGESGNYKYVYHSVADVIRAICDDETIDVPVTPNNNTISNDKNLNTTGTDSVCIDIDYNELGDGFSEIASECINECKEPNQYNIPTFKTWSTGSTVGKNISGIADYKRAVVVRKEYGFDGSAYNTPYVTEGQRVSRIKNTLSPATVYNPGIVSSCPIWIPDVFQDPDIDYLSTDSLEAKYYGLRSGEISIDFSSNTFIWDQNDSAETGDLYIVIWASVLPGGQPLGDPEASNYKLRGFHIIDAPNGVKSYNDCFWTTIYERWIDSQDPNSELYERYAGYLGNMYGARYINIVTMKQDLKDTYNFDVPEVGSQDFWDLISERGFKSNETRFWGFMPAPDCTKFTNVNIPGDTGKTLTYDEKYTFLG